MEVNNNIASLIALRLNRSSEAELQLSMKRIATGHRINSGSDDPAGLITSEKLRAALAQIDAEAKALQRADQVANTADGALAEVSDLLGEAEALAVANADDSISDEERAANQMEIDSILSTVNRIANTTTFNGDRLLDGTAELSAAGRTLSIGSAYTADLGETEIDGGFYTIAHAGSGGMLDTTSGGAESAQTVFAAARSEISAMRGSIGAFQSNTIHSRLNTLSVTSENVASAESLIRDTDYAHETSQQVRAALLQQASIDALYSAGRQPRSVLSLLV